MCLKKIEDFKIKLEVALCKTLDSNMPVSTFLSWRTCDICLPCLVKKNIWKEDGE